MLALLLRSIPPKKRISKPSFSFRIRRRRKEEEEGEEGEGAI